MMIEVSSLLSTSPPAKKFGATTKMRLLTPHHYWRQFTASDSWSNGIIELSLVSISKRAKYFGEYPFEHEGSNQNMPTPSIHNGRILVGGENRGLRSVEPILSGSTWSVTENWHQEDVALDMSSAVVNGDHLYGFSHYEKGRLFSVDTKSGEVVWQGPRRTGANVTFLSMPGHVIALTDKGDLKIVQAQGAKSKEIASYKVADSPTWSAPVLLKDAVLIKDHDKLALWSFK